MHVLRCRTVCTAAPQPTFSSSPCATAPPAAAALIPDAPAEGLSCCLCWESKGARPLEPPENSGGKLPAAAGAPIPLPTRGGRDEVTLLAGVVCAGVGTAGFAGSVVAAGSVLLPLSQSGCLESRPPTTAPCPAVPVGTEPGKQCMCSQRQIVRAFTARLTCLDDTCTFQSAPAVWAEA